MFKQYITEMTQDEIEDIDEESISREDIIEMIDELDDDELQEIGELILDIIYEPDFDDDDIDDIEEALHFKKRKAQVNRAKKTNRSKRRKDAKKRKIWYRRNKAKVKRYQKKARRKNKTGKTAGGKRMRSHR